MPLPRRDFLTFLFNEGRGVQMSQIDGVQTHLTSTAWDDVDDPQTLIIGPTLERQPDQMLLFFRLPFAIPRTDTALTARIGAANVERPVVGIDGGAVAPRDVNPGCLHGMLIDTGAARFIEPLPPRAQDFDIVVAWADPAGTGDFAAADVAAAGATFSTPDITIPAQYPGTTNQTARLWIGIPEDAREIDRIVEDDNHAANLFNLRRDRTETAVWMGTQYKWWRHSNLAAGGEYLVIYGITRKTKEAGVYLLMTRGLILAALTILDALEAIADQARLERERN